MNSYPSRQSGVSRHAPVIDARRLWAGGVATAVIAALTTLVGILVARSLFDVVLLAPKKSGTWGDASTPTYAAAGFGAGLLATAIMHVLLIVTPAPFVFFGWIMALSIVAVTLAPFLASANRSAQIASAAINCVVGLAIWTLTTSTARRCVRP